MVITQSRPKRKLSGARYHAYRKKRQYEAGGLPTHTKIGETKRKKDRTVGGNNKMRLILANIANVLDPKTKKYQKAKIKTVVDNPANRHFVRRNIITKGTVIDTDLGKARVVSRPGQDGTVNAVLV
ncbi:30S ribosomal protein S8e [Candidatus Woesearchaeota archaeon]|nr:30S ribosomal protein S8e [Candidatus Woesearchaeota archaeon]